MSVTTTSAQAQAPGRSAEIVSLQSQVAEEVANRRRDPTYELTVLADTTRAIIRTKRDEYDTIQAAKTIRLGNLAAAFEAKAQKIEADIDNLNRQIDLLRAEKIEARKSYAADAERARDFYERQAEAVSRMMAAHEAMLAGLAEDVTPVKADIPY